MRSFLSFLSALIVILLLYSLFYLTVTGSNRNRASSTITNTDKNLSSWKNRSSIQQIDSLTAFENYRFTIANYYKDSVPKKAVIEKAAKI
jgi:hypothetical protein